MGISIEQFRSRIGSHDNFVKTKDASVLEYNANDVLFKCILFADTETSCYAIQNVESSDVLVYTNDVLQCLYSIAYKTSK